MTEKPSEKPAREDYIRNGSLDTESGPHPKSDVEGGLPAEHQLVRQLKNRE
jgi:hypothetical protein